MPEKSEWKCEERKQKTVRKRDKKMKRIMEFLLITLLAFVITTAFLTVDKRSAENIGFKQSLEQIM